MMTDTQVDDILMEIFSDYLLGKITQEEAEKRQKEIKEMAINKDTYM